MRFVGMIHVDYFRVGLSSRDRDYDYDSREIRYRLSPSVSDLALRPGTGNFQLGMLF